MDSLRALHRLVTGTLHNGTDSAYARAFNCTCPHTCATLVHTHSCLHTCLHTNNYAQVYAHVYTHVRTNKYAQVYKHVHINVYAHVVVHSGTDLVLSTPVPEMYSAINRLRTP